MKKEFLDTVQAAGWHILKAEESHVVGGCRAMGCKMRANLRQGCAIPQVVAPVSHPHDIPIRTYDDVRRVLRQRRNELALAISEVEGAAGMATDHLAKAEKDMSVRIPNIQIVMEWAESLGMEFILRPSSLPPITLRTIEQTREHTPRRRKAEVRDAGSKRRA